MQWVEGANLSEWMGSQVAKAKHLCIASPFITMAGLRPVLDGLKRRRSSVDVTVATHLDTVAALTGALDLDALKELISCTTGTQHTVSVFDVPGLHAKVYLVDERAAVIGSGNMTQHGTGGLNIELGIGVTKKADVQELRAKLDSWVRGRRPVTLEEIEQHERIIDEHYTRFKGLARIDIGRLRIFYHPAHDYFAGLMVALNRAKGAKGCAKKPFLEALSNPEKGQDDSTAPDMRMVFLKYLGLIDQRGECIHLTDLGHSLRGKNGRAVLLERLCERVPEVREVLCAFERDPDRTFSYKELQAAFAGCTDGGPVSQMEDCVRWLRSLRGVVERKPTPTGAKTFRLAKRAAAAH